MRSATLLALAGLLAIPALAGESGLGPAPIYSTYVNGDFTVAGATSRGFPTGQTDPFPITVGGVPGGGTVVKAFASWNYLTATPGDPGEASITINGSPVSGALVGSGDPDLCWGMPFGASYLADVTGLVTGNGVYSIGSATDTAAGALGEGVSLLLVYDDGGPTREVNVYAGYTSTESTGSGVAAATLGWTTPFGGVGGFHFFTNGLDGQFAGDQFDINGSDASALAGGAPGDSWIGLLGPAAPGSNYYDHAEGDISAYLGLGDTSLGFTTTSLSDCIGHTFAAVSLLPEPSSLLLLALGGLALRRR